MKQTMTQTCKLCETKMDKPSYAWQIVSKKTGKALRHIRVDGKGLAFAGVEWNSLSAFAWAKKNENVIPHFCERSAERTAALYKLQTGDEDVKIVRVLVA
jgi:hypothetical protein